jgi:hypothetical protein
MKEIMKNLIDELITKLIVMEKGTRALPNTKLNR